MNAVSLVLLILMDLHIPENILISASFSNPPCSLSPNVKRSPMMILFDSIRLRRNSKVMLLPFLSSF